MYINVPIVVSYITLNMLTRLYNKRIEIAERCKQICFSHNYSRYHSTSNYNTVRTMIQLAKPVRECSMIYN